MLFRVRFPFTCSGATAALGAAVVKSKSRIVVPALYVRLLQTHWPPDVRTWTPLVAPDAMVRALFAQEPPVAPTRPPATTAVAPV